MGPLASGNPTEGPWAWEGAHRNETAKSACEARRPFFFFFEDHLNLTGTPLKFQ